MTPFLTAEELAELTGYKLAAKQRKWLARNGFPFIENAAGRPIVSCAAAEARLGGKDSKTGRVLPNYSGVT